MKSNNSIAKQKSFDIVVDILDFTELDQIIGGATDKKDVQVGCFVANSGGCKAVIEDVN